MSAAVYPLRVDPANDQFYALSQEAELRLRHVAEGAEAIGMLMEGLDRDVVEVPETLLANVFHMIAFAIGSAMRDAAFVTPKP